MSSDLRWKAFPATRSISIKSHYSDAPFDLVTASEVVEHVENYRSLLREVFRTMKSGGIIVITTPNVLNAKSRIRYSLSGFANLFGPLPVCNDKLYPMRGHITAQPPISAWRTPIWMPNSRTLNRASTESRERPSAGSSRSIPSSFSIGSGSWRTNATDSKRTPQKTSRVSPHASRGRFSQAAPSWSQPSSRPRPLYRRLHR
jgi:hypothetical protein